MSVNSSVILLMLSPSVHPPPALGLAAQVKQAVKWCGVWRLFVKNHLLTQNSMTQLMTHLITSL